MSDIRQQDRQNFVEACVKPTQCQNGTGNACDNNTFRLASKPTEMTCGDAKALLGGVVPPSTTLDGDHCWHDHAWF